MFAVATLALALLALALIHDNARLRLEAYAREWDREAREAGNDTAAA